MPGATRIEANSLTCPAVRQTKETEKETKQILLPFEGDERRN
jgi:hypothetical protein